MEIVLKPISSLEKCFLDESIDAKREINSLSALAGETLCFQLAYTISPNPPSADNVLVYLHVDSPVKEYVKASRIESVPVRFATYSSCVDENYLRKAPGLYPDLMIPISEASEIYPMNASLQSIWIDVEIPRGFEGGEYPIKLSFTTGAEGTGDTLASTEFNVKVIPADLPEQELIVTQWFHCDCLAEYYGVEVFSEKHWEIIENYMKCAAKNGMNAILTPVFTPPLDTAVGKERPTVQLVEVYDGSKQWGFDFTKLDRWIDLAQKCGLKYFEISHFFTQWGANHAPKIMGWRGGNYLRLFGWDTDATSDEYTGFLRAFIRKFIEHMKSRGLDKNCLFHVSDEPNESHTGSYAMAKSIIADLLEGYTMIDALSSVSFYQSGLVQTPIPAINHIEDFLAAKVPNLWTYYCCGQHTDVSNRFIAMPLSRTRIIGSQFYKYSIVGFLQWGYNFWFSMGSQGRMNPFVNTDAGRVPAGDAYSVYPAPDGSAYESIRIRSFYEAICDLRAMKLCEELCGREAVMDAIESTFPQPFDCKHYPQDGIYILILRNKINSLIESKISGSDK
ncbi:MAG: DUF4091 domain-containing protein [Ruminococcaceae bacterium]|nr:DUF4091 domain-containing protein [Oscillospiraceae bacterium]